MISNTLSDAFNLTRLTIDENLPAEVEEPAGHALISRDFDEARTNIKSLTKTGMSAVNELAELATKSQNPRFYEALTSALKAAGDLNQQLMDIHGTVREASNIKSGQLEQRPNQVQNNLFITTADLQAMITKAREENAKIIE